MMETHCWVRLGLLATTLCVGFAVVVGNEETSVTIRTKTPSHTVSERFISLSVDPSILLQNDLSPSLTKIISFLRGLNPAYIRLGGSGTNNYKYLNSKGDNKNQTTINEAQWVIFNEFAQNNGLEPIVCLNALARLDGHWDPTNAVELIAYSARLKYKLGWQLGYELQSAESPITGEQFGKDYASFRSILRTFPSYANATILGPDMTHYTGAHDVDFLASLVRAAGDAVTSVVWHPNISADSEANLQLLVSDIYKEKDLVSRQLGDILGSKDVWMAESEDERNASKGEYVDALRWALKLGAAASLGIQVVLKHPGMVHFQHPTPDYWVSFLHKSLVGRVVLENHMNGPDSQVQVYSHCARTGGVAPSRYTSGAMTLFGVNPLSHRVSLVLRTTAWQGATRPGEVHQYSITSTDIQEPLKAKNVVLNGQLLSMDKLGNLPVLTPEVMPYDGDLVLNLPGQSVVFWVFPHANVSACLSFDADAVGSMPTSLQSRSFPDDDVEQVYPVEDTDAEMSEVQVDAEFSEAPTDEQVSNSFQGVGRLDKNSTVNGMLHDMLQSANPFPLTSPTDRDGANHTAAKVITDKDWDEIKDKYLISKFMFVLKRDPKTLQDKVTPLADQEIITVSNDETFGQRFSRALENGLYTIPGLDLKLYQPTSFKSPLQSMKEPLVESLKKPLESLKRLREERWEKLQMKKLEDGGEEETVKASLAVPGTLFGGELAAVETTTKKNVEYVYVDETASPEAEYYVDEGKVGQKFPANGPWEIYEGVGMKTKKMRNKNKDYGELWAAESIKKDKEKTEEKVEKEIIEKEEMTPMEIKHLARKVAKAHKKKLENENKSLEPEKIKEKGEKKTTEPADKEEGVEATKTTTPQREEYQFAIIEDVEDKQMRHENRTRRRRRHDPLTDASEEHKSSEQIFEDLSIHEDEATPPPPPPPPPPRASPNDHISVIKSLISIRKDPAKKAWIDSTMKLSEKDPDTHIMNINAYNEALRVANETERLMAQIAANKTELAVGEESQVAPVNHEQEEHGQVEGDFKEHDEGDIEGHIEEIVEGDAEASVETTTTPKRTNLFAEEIGKDISKKLKHTNFLRRLNGERKSSTAAIEEITTQQTGEENAETDAAGATEEGEEATTPTTSTEGGDIEVTTRMSLLSALGVAKAAGKKRRMDDTAIDKKLEEETENQSTANERNVRESKVPVFEIEDMDALMVKDADDNANDRNVRESQVIATKISPDKTPAVEVKTINIPRRSNDLDLASFKLPSLPKAPVIPDRPKLLEIPKLPVVAVDAPQKVNINQLGERFGATARKAKENVEGVAKKMREMTEERLKSGRVFQPRNKETIPVIKEKTDSAVHELSKLEKTVSDFAKYKVVAPVETAKAVEQPKIEPVVPAISSEMKKLRERIFQIFDKSNPKERKMLPKVAKELASVEQSLRSKIAPPPNFELRQNAVPVFPKLREMMARTMSTIAPPNFPLAGLRRAGELPAAAPLPEPFRKFSLKKLEPPTTAKPEPKEVIQHQARSFASDIEDFAGKVSKQFQEIPQIGSVVTKTKDYLGEMNRELKKDVNSVSKKIKEIPESVGEKIKDNTQINAAVSKTKELISKIDEDLKKFRSAPAPSSGPNQLEATNVAVKDKLDGVVRRMEEINTDLRDAIVRRPKRSVGRPKRRKALRYKRSVGRHSAKGNLLTSKLLDEEIYNANSHNKKRNYRKSLRYNSYDVSGEKHVISRRDVLKDDTKLVSYLIYGKPIPVDKVKTPIVYRYASNSDDDDDEIERLRDQLKTMKENRKNAIEELLNENQPLDNFPRKSSIESAEYINAKDAFASNNANVFGGLYDEEFYDTGYFDLERMRRQVPYASGFRYQDDYNDNLQEIDDKDFKLVEKRGIYDNRIDDESIERIPVKILPTLDHNANTEGLNYFNRLRIIAAPNSIPSNGQANTVFPSEGKNYYPGWNANVFPQEAVFDVMIKKGDVEIQQESQLGHSLGVDLEATSESPLNLMEQGEVIPLVDATGEGNKETNKEKLDGIFQRFVNRFKSLFGNPGTTHVET